MARVMTSPASRPQTAPFDLHAAILHLMGIDHRRLTFRFQGLDQKLTGVEEESHVVTKILS